VKQLSWPAHSGLGVYVGSPHNYRGLGGRSSLPIGSLRGTLDGAPVNNQAIANDPCGGWARPGMNWGLSKPSAASSYVHCHVRQHRVGLTLSHPFFFFFFFFLRPFKPIRCCVGQPPTKPPAFLNFAPAYARPCRAEGGAAVAQPRAAIQGGKQHVSSIRRADQPAIGARPPRPRSNRKLSKISCGGGKISAEGRHAVQLQAGALTRSDTPNLPFPLRIVKGQARS